MRIDDAGRLTLLIDTDQTDRVQVSGVRDIAFGQGDIDAGKLFIIANNGSVYRSNLIDFSSRIKLPLPPLDSDGRSIRVADFDVSHDGIYAFGHEKGVKLSLPSKEYVFYGLD